MSTRICRNMESDLFSMEDELFLFETFLKLSSQDYNDEAEVFFSEEDSDVSLDVPLYDFFMYDNGERGLNVWVRGWVVLQQTNLLYFTGYNDVNIY